MHFFGNVALDPGQLTRVGVIDPGGDSLSFGNGPDARLALLDHLAELGKFGGEVHDAERGLAAAIDVAAVDGSIIVEELLVLLVDLVLELGKVGVDGPGSGTEQ